MRKCVCLDTRLLKSVGFTEYIHQPKTLKKNLDFETYIVV